MRAGLGGVLVARQSHRIAHPRAVGKITVQHHFGRAAQLGDPVAAGAGVFLRPAADVTRRLAVQGIGKPAFGIIDAMGIEHLRIRRLVQRAPQDVPPDVVRMLLGVTHVTVLEVRTECVVPVLLHTQVLCGRHDPSFVTLLIHRVGHRQLPQLRRAYDPLGALLSRPQTGQQNGHENCHDGNHHEQLDQCETTLRFMLWAHLPSFLPFFRSRCLTDAAALHFGRCPRSTVSPARRAAVPAPPVPDSTPVTGSPFPASRPPVR